MAVCMLPPAGSPSWSPLPPFWRPCLPQLGSTQSHLSLTRQEQGFRRDLLTVMTPGRKARPGGIRSLCLLGLEGSGSHGWALGREIQVLRHPLGPLCGGAGQGEKPEQADPRACCGTPAAPPGRRQEHRGWGCSLGPWSQSMAAQYPGLRSPLMGLLAQKRQRLQLGSAVQREGKGGRRTGGVILPGPRR